MAGMLCDEKWVFFLENMKLDNRFVKFFDIQIAIMYIPFFCLSYVQVRIDTVKRLSIVW